MSDASILDTILSRKRVEVKERTLSVPLEELQKRCGEQSPSRDFRGAIIAGSSAGIALIAEVKKASPSAGIIRTDFDPVTIAREFEDAGAACLSVLTDTDFFQGNDQYLTDIHKVVNIPLLRKDFTIHAYQIYEARSIGADAILLIVSALSPFELAEFQTLAHELGMAALVEVHSEAEMEAAKAVGASLIGINSRNLNSFVTDLSVVERLAPMVDEGDVTLVAESGIRTPDDVRRVQYAGAHAILVGETLMESADISQSVRKLLTHQER